MLLYGPPGLGKTTLANIIARELGVNLHATSGPAIERPGDLAAILTNLEERDVLFIDEIHRLNHSVEEILYPAMEDFAIDVMIGRGPSARSLRLSLKPFTVIGATTRAGRSRRSAARSLRRRLSARLLQRRKSWRRSSVARPASSRSTSKTQPSTCWRVGGGARRESSIACCGASATTPRSSRTVESAPREATDAMNAMDIDDEGLDTTDRRLLAAIVQKFASGPVGGAAVAAVIGEEVDTIEDVYEPYLLQLGFLDRTPQGRVATERARDHLRGLGYDDPAAATRRPDGHRVCGTASPSEGRTESETWRDRRLPPPPTRHSGRRLTQPRQYQRSRLSPADLAVATRGLVKSYGSTPGAHGPRHVRAHAARSTASSGPTARARRPRCAC